MKKRYKNSKHIATISVIVVTLIIAALANWFQYFADRAVVNSTLREMEKIGDQQEYILEDSIEEAHNKMLTIAKYITDENLSYENTMKYLKAQLHVDDLENLYYIDLNGNGISATNNEYNFSDYKFFEHSSKGDYYITEPNISVETSEIIFYVSVPVVKNGTTQAVLYAKFIMVDFLIDYINSTQEKGDMFIVDQNLNFVYSTSEGHVGAATIPEGDVEQMGIENVEQAKTNIVNGENGSFMYNYYGTKKVMAYMPINMTEWALAINVEADLINDELVVAVNQLKFICQAIYWSFIIVIVYIWRSQAKSVKKLEFTAYYDKLTGMPNIEKLKNDMRQVLSHNKNNSYTILLFDIENFKVFNEMYGFEMGNRVLKTMKLFSDSLKEPSLIFARISSDQFAMFAVSSFLSNVDELYNSCLDLYRKTIPELNKHTVSFNCGRYIVENGETDADDIFNKVNLAHKKAREALDQYLCDYDDEFKNKLLKDAEIGNKMTSALEKEEFVIYLQPKFSVFDDDLIGAEALVRWVQADGEMVYPNDFIPLFEKNGFIIKLDSYVLEKTCEAIRKWMDFGYAPITVSVNLSRINLSNFSIVDDIIKIVDKYNVPHKYIEIELTESASIDQEDALELLYSKLQENGFKTSIDDFGSGYSSLAMMKNFNVNTLKLDRSFFVGSKSVRRDEMLIDGIVKLAHSLGMYVVAEGIETQKQIELLRNMNCDAVQGYVYSRPMPLKEFELKYGESMKKKESRKKEKLPLINNINDAQYANSFVPCGIIVSEIDESFTMIEANDGYFDIIGFTRKEVRDLFDNKGINVLHKDDRDKALKYFTDKMTYDPESKLEHVCRITTKHHGYIMAKFSGKVSENEKGQRKLYFSLIDLSTFEKETSEI